MLVNNFLQRNCKKKKKIVTEIASRWLQIEKRLNSFHKEFMQNYYEDCDKGYIQLMSSILRNDRRHSATYHFYPKE